MNNKRRAELAKAIPFLEKAKDILEEVRNEEEDAFYSLPESLQNSERGNNMETIFQELENACMSLQDIVDTIQEFI